MKAKVTAIILAALLVAGSVTALAAGGRGGMGGRNGNFGSKPPQIERVERPEKGEKPELTEEQKASMLAEMLEKLTVKLDEMLANGEITEEQYNERLEKLEAGEIPFGHTVGKGFGRGIKGEKPEMPKDFEKPEKPELTEEQKAEMLEKLTEKLDEMLANGEITEEQYNEYLAKVEAGELPFGQTVGKGFGRDNGFGRGKTPVRGKNPVRGFGGFEGRGNGFGRRPSEIPSDGDVEASEAEDEVVEVRANARKTFGGRNFGGMRKDSDVKL